MVSDPLYQFAQRYLVDNDLNLTRWMDEPTRREMEAIRLVNAESQRQADERRKALEGK